MRSRGELEAVAPDLLQPVIGFRQWSVRDGRLHSLMRDDEWTNGELAARCHSAAHPRADRDVLPSERCSCGIYAYYRPLPRTASAMWGDLVSGAVALWGDVQAHATGLRAQYAQAVVFALPMRPGRKRRELVGLAQELGVEAVPAGHIQRAALAHGGPLPDALKPPKARVDMPGTRRWWSAAVRMDG
jgi:hypothetical protein